MILHHNTSILYKMTINKEEIFIPLILIQSILRYGNQFILNLRIQIEEYNQNIYYKLIQIMNKVILLCACIALAMSSFFGGGNYLNPSYKSQGNKMIGNQNSLRLSSFNQVHGNHNVARNSNGNYIHGVGTFTQDSDGSRIQGIGAVGLGMTGGSVSGIGKVGLGQKFVQSMGGQKFLQNTNNHATNTYHSVASQYNIRTSGPNDNYMQFTY